MILELTKIRTDGGTQVRAVIDQEVVQTYAEAMRTHSKFPHITVFYDGTDYWLADGFHRLEALKLLGKDIAVVDAIQGSLREAILFSVGANSKHGLPRTKQDTHRAIETLLRDKAWGKSSDRWIAEQCRVHHETVTRVRAAMIELAANASSFRVGKDGKTRKLPTKRVTSSLPVGQASSPSTKAETSVASSSDQVLDSVTSNPSAGRAVAPGPATIDQVNAIGTVTVARPAARRGRSTQPARQASSVSGPSADPPSAEQQAGAMRGNAAWIDELVQRVGGAPIAVLVELKKKLDHAFAARGL